MNIKLFLECNNSDGLTGFDYSHDGWWYASGMLPVDGARTSLECANACMQGCFAIDTDATASIAKTCFHYTNKEELTDDNKRPSFAGEHFKAYIKC